MLNILRIAKQRKELAILWKHKASRLHGKITRERYDDKQKGLKHIGMRIDQKNGKPMMFVKEMAVARMEEKRAQ